MRPSSTADRIAAALTSVCCSAVLGESSVLDGSVALVLLIFTAGLLNALGEVGHAFGED
jgi:hypothetical protein